MCDSRFDRDSAAACHEELAALPRVANGRCKVGVLGMRVDRRTRGHAALESWAAEQGMDFLGSLRDTQLYVHCADRGLTVFDLPAAKAAADTEEWKPVLAWLEKAAAAARAAGARRGAARRCPAGRADASRGPEHAVHAGGARLRAVAVGRRQAGLLGRAAPASGPLTLGRHAGATPARMP